MAVHPKLSSTTVSVAQRIRRAHPDQLELHLDPQEISREPCEDAEGNRYTVIVWRLYPGLARTDYTLEDGSLVKFVDDCLFEIENTGTLITRCL